MPITWRNVNAPSNSAGVNLLKEARQSVNDGLAGLKGVTDSINNDRVSRFEGEKARNTDLYLDTIAGAKTTEDLDAAQSGLAAIRQRAGAAINSDEIRGASDRQRTALQDQFLQQQEFDQTQRDTAAAPLMEELETMITNGQLREGDQFLKANQGRLVELGYGSKAAEALRTGQDKAVERTRQKINQERADLNYTQGQEKIAKEKRTSSNGESLNRIARESIQETLGLNGTMEDARSIANRRFNDFASDNNVDPTQITQALSQLPNMYEGLTQLGTETQAELARGTASTQAAMENDVERERLAFERTREQLPVDGVVTFLSGERKKISDAATLMTGKDYEGALFSDVVTDLNEAVDKFINNSPQKFSEQDRQAVDQLVYEYATGLGDGKSFGERDDVSISSVEKYLKSNWSRWMDSKKNMALRTKAETNYLDAKARIEGKAASDIEERYKAATRAAKGQSNLTARAGR